jgi:hypothetical protein
MVHRVNLSGSWETPRGHAVKSSPNCTELWTASVSINANLRMPTSSLLNVENKSKASESTFATTTQILANKWANP